jgi:hypothetical protein
MEIIRKKQIIDSKLIYLNRIYNKNYVDFDLSAIDNKFIYIGFFTTRGTLVDKVILI